jgi:UDP-N-acetyl-D-glucosamine dehydrogenase
MTKSSALPQSRSVYTEISDELAQKIRDKTAVIGVIGLGYVGLPLAVEKAKVGFTVIGFDQNLQRVGFVNHGKNYIKDVKDEDLLDVTDSFKLRASADFARLSDVDVVIICVPTPLTATRDPDISYIVNVTDEVAKNLHRGQLVTLESTTYPGTTSEVVLPRLESTGLKVGIDFFLAFSPERVDPGNKRFTTKNTSKVVGGITPACLSVAKTFYEQTITRVVPVSSTAIAEMTKVFENIYRSVNIALVNEMMLLCDRMEIDIWEVVEAASTKPFGIQTFYPGPGVGGHCIPIDPFYLTWKAREYDFHTRFIELAGEINIQASYHVVSKTARMLGKRRKSLNGAKILVLGVAYKKDIEDYRESPALKIIQLLRQENAQVTYHDPYVPEILAHPPYNWNMNSVDLNEYAIKRADGIMILTDHSTIDYEHVVRNAELVIDARNATKEVGVEYRHKIFKI